MSGGLAAQNRQSRVTTGLETWSEGISGVTTDPAPNVKMNFARSGAVALGKKETGHPAQSELPLIATLPSDDERTVD